MDGRRTTPVLLTLTLWILASGAAAAEEPPAVPRLGHPKGAYRVGWVQLRGDGGEATPLYLALRDGKVTVAWLAGDTLCGLDGPARTYVNEIAVQEQDGRLTGVLKLRRQKGKFGAEPVELSLDMALDGTGLNGTWQAKVGDQSAKGTASGQLRPADAMRKSEVPAADASWPTKLGPTWDGRAAPSDAALIDDLRQARPVWRSEDYMPTGWGNGPDSRYLHRAQLSPRREQRPFRSGSRSLHHFFFREPVSRRFACRGGAFRDLPVCAPFAALGGVFAFWPTEATSGLARAPRAPFRPKTSLFARGISPASGLRPGSPDVAKLFLEQHLHRRHIRT